MFKSESDCRFATHKAGQMPFLPYRRIAEVDGFANRGGAAYGIALYAEHIGRTDEVGSRARTRMRA